MYKSGSKPWHLVYYDFYKFISGPFQFIILFIRVQYFIFIFLSSSIFIFLFKCVFAYFRIYCTCCCRCCCYCCCMAFVSRHFRSSLQLNSKSCQWAQQQQQQQMRIVTNNKIVVSEVGTRLQFFVLFFSLN